jgi:hypothetical protein
MSDYVFGDKVGGDKVGRDKIGGDVHRQSGSHNTFTVNKAESLSRAELDAAVAELRDFVAQLTRAGAVGTDGSVTDPAAVVAAVESQPGRLKALGRALAGGAKDAILQVVRGGVAALVVALVGRAG